MYGRVETQRNGKKTQAMSNMQPLGEGIELHELPADILGQCSIVEAQPSTDRWPGWLRLCLLATLVVGSWSALILVGALIF